MNDSGRPFLTVRSSIRGSSEQGLGLYMGIDLLGINDILGITIKTPETRLIVMCRVTSMCRDFKSGQWMLHDH